MEFDANDVQESELEDLKLRINQLEHLVVSKTLDTTLNTSLPSNVVPNVDGLINRTSQLERLLAASELENCRLRDEINLLNVKLQRQHVYYEEILEGKERDILDAKYEAELHAKKTAAHERKLKNIESYIHTLPSEEELTSAKEKIKKLEVEVAEWERKACRFEQNIKTLTKQLFYKESQYQDALLRLEELKPFQEAHESILEDEQAQRINLSDHDEVLKYVAILRSQLEQLKKIIQSHRAKIERLNEDKIQYTSKISSQSLLLNESREQYLSSQVQCDELFNKIKALNQQNLELSNKYDALKAQTAKVLESRELRLEQYESVIRLVAEIDFCVSEMNNYVEIGKRLLSAEELDVETLVSLADFDFRSDPSSEDCDSESLEPKSCNEFSKRLNDYLSKLSKEGDLNLEWCLQCWENVRQSRKKVMELKNELKELYVQKLSSSDDGCPIQ